jgi:hypothetical protein
MPGVPALLRQLGDALAHVVRIKLCDGLKIVQVHS